MSGLLHRLVWRNDVEKVDAVLEEQPSCIQEADEESGWTPLHVALYYGYLRIAARLLKAQARLDATDLDDRTPLELVSKELSVTEDSRTEVFSWGSGANCQLGTGHTGWQSHPRRLETLADATVAEVGAAKFHSMAVTSDGKLYTWGWGLGGRLGHPDSKLHSENSAEIFPRLVAQLSERRIVSVAAAKHHSLAVTSTGEVFSWGLNRDGRLGYGSSAGKQVVPKKIAALKGITAVHAAAANKHSAIISDGGLVYTWGSNVHGQLGYGTFDSGSNPKPRCVEGLKHKSVAQVSLSKRHSLALTKDGDVYSWGYKGVAPGRILLQGSRDQQSLNCKGDPIHFHRGSHKVRKPIAVMVAASLYESCCLTTTGVVLSWDSAKPEGNMKEIGGKLSGKAVTSISAGKTVTTAVTKDGRVYSWTISSSQQTPRPELVSGMKNTFSVAVGEQHMLALQKWTPAPVSLFAGMSEAGSESAFTHPSTYVSVASELDVGDESNAFKCLSLPKSKKETKPATGEVPSLQSLCERAVAQYHLNPRTALQFLCYADVSRASFLKSCCLHLIIHNLALVLHESHKSLMEIPDEILAEIERLYQEKVLLMDTSEGSDWWNKGQSEEKSTPMTRRPTQRLLSTTDPSSPIIHSSNSKSSEKSVMAPSAGGNRFLPKQKSLEKLHRSMKDKLKQIMFLEQRLAAGEVLESGQREKIARRNVYQKALDALENGAVFDDVQKILTETQPAAAVALKLQSFKKPKKPMDKKKPLTSPNLHPVLPVQPRCRDIGPMPCFLEPSRTKKKPAAATPPTEQDQSVSLHEANPLKGKKWVKLELQSKPKTRGSVVAKAQPSKETRKMSLSDFMAAPPDPPPAPAKETIPAWGGLRYHDQTSFQSIQKEQRNRRPGMQSASGPKPVVETRRTVSRWQTHVDVQVQSINCIQIEERAVQELTALYKGATVRVRPGTARDTGKKKLLPER